MLVREIPSWLAAGLVLAVTGLTGAMLLAGTEWHSAPLIAANQRAALIKSLAEVMPPEGFDNDLLADSLELAAPELLGMPGPTRVYRACHSGKTVAVAFRLVAPEGYSGPIELLLGATVQGVVSGVRVLAHRETPGLGDAIELRRSDWILGFDGKSRSDPGPAGWRVARDGGEFDQFTGATITPRAVVKAVRLGLEFVASHHDRLFDAGCSAPGEIDSGENTP